MRSTWLTVALLGACGDDQASVTDAAPPALDAGAIDARRPPPEAGSCPRDERTRTASMLAGLVGGVPDVTGDGRDDFLVAAEGKVELMAGPVPGTRRFSYATETSFFVTFATGDLDGDGERDLVIGTPWSSEVAVFFVPLPEAGSAADAPLLVSLPSGGLANRFGLGIHVGDVTGDGVLDLIVGAPAEGEEACFGTDDSVVFAGPLAAGRLGRDDASIRIAADTTRCLGHPIQAAQLGDPSRPSLLLGGAEEAVWFELPLAPAPSPAGRRSGRYLAGANDLDGDGRLDLIFQSSIQYGDGRDVELRFDPAVFVQVYAPVAWMTGGPDVLLDVGGTTIRRLIAGETDPQALPVVATTVGHTSSFFASAADLDDDGLTDLVVGNQWIRCAE